MKTTLYLLADAAGPDVGTVLLILLGLVGVLVFAFIGRLIGQKRGQGEGGAAMGALLGPVGLVGAAFLPDQRRQCPDCKGRVPDDATKCMHCGSTLPLAQRETPPKEIPFPIARSYSAPLTIDPVEEYKKWKAAQPPDDLPKPTMGDPVEDYKAWKAEQEK